MNNPRLGTEYDPTDNLVEELKRLRKGHGLTREKLCEARALLDLPCISAEVASHRTNRGSTTEELANAAMELLKRLLANNRESHTSALRNAYAMDHPGERGNLTDRRRAYARRQKISVDTLRNYEERRINELRLELLSLSNPIEHDLAVPPVPQPEPAGQSVSDRNIPDLRVTSAEAIYRFESGRIPSQFFVMRTVRALQDGVRGYRNAASYSGGNEHVEYEAVDGCSVRWEQTNWAMSDDVIVVVAEFDRLLYPGDIHTFSYRRRFSSASKEPKPYVCHTLPYPTDLLKIIIQFAAESVPQMVWSFTAIVGLSASEEPQDAIVPINGYASYEFNNCYVGRTYGLRWIW